MFVPGYFYTRVASFTSTIDQSLPVTYVARTMDQREAKIRSVFGTVTNAYDTHRPALCEAVVKTSGAILELGMGEGSTRALHSVAEEYGRIVHSYDHGLEWVSRYESLRSPNHEIAYVATWDDCPIESAEWSVAFVDHAPAERRRIDIARLAHRAQVIVVHDTESPIYGYDEILASFAHRLDYRAVSPWTTLVSNFVDVSRWTI